MRIARFVQYNKRVGRISDEKRRRSYRKKSNQFSQAKAHYIKSNSFNFVERVFFPIAIRGVNSSMEKSILQAPTRFNGSLQELYEQWSQWVLINYQAIKKFHLAFCEYYIGSEKPIFLIRMVRGLERGETVQNSKGNLLRATDNAPAWWIHYQLFTNIFDESPTFSALINRIPCHMFQVQLPTNISQSGWHVAHIFDVKDRRTDYEYWDRKELLRRTARNIHPCNYFYIPKTDWQSYGGDPTVIAFFYEKFQRLYDPIWDEFLNLVDGQPEKLGRNPQTFHYSFPKDEKETISNRQELQSYDTQNRPNQKSRSSFGYKEVYPYSRLCFKADIIEPLNWDDEFCIVTPEGSFAMSKRDFYETFPNVVKSLSYQRDKLYHYSVIPKKALKFKLS